MKALLSFYAVSSSGLLLSNSTPEKAKKYIQETKPARFSLFNQKLPLCTREMRGIKHNTHQHTSQSPSHWDGRNPRQH